MPWTTTGIQYLVTLPSSPHSPRTGEGSRAVDQVDSDLSRVGRINVVASVGWTEDKNSSNLSVSGSGLSQVSQGEYRGAPQRESHLESDGYDPDVLDDADQAFLMNHFRKGTRGAYRTGWCWFQEFYKEYRVNTQLAPLPLTVKFVRHLFDSGVFCSVVRTAISAISKYHIIDANMENTIG